MPLPATTHRDCARVLNGLPFIRSAPQQDATDQTGQLKYCFCLYQSTWSNVLEDLNLQQKLCKNLKFRTAVNVAGTLVGRHRF
jgi:hypothetical protein